MKPRLIKKQETDDYWLGQFLEWMRDYRAYLLEAMAEGTDIRIITRQFKERYTKGRKRKNGKYFTATRLNMITLACLDFKRYPIL